MISDILCIGVPVKIRPKLEVAFSRFGISLQFPSVEISVDQLRVRLSKSSGTVVALWQKQSREVCAKIFEVNAQIYRLSTGNIWKSSGEGSVSEAISFNLELLPNVEAATADNPEGIGRIEALWVPETHQADRAFQAKEAAGAHSQGVVLVPQLRSTTDRKIEADVMKLLHVSRSLKAVKPSLVTNTADAAGTVRDMLRRCQPYLGNIVAAVCQPSMLAGAERVITLSTWIALESAARGIPVTHAADATFGERFSTPEQAIDALSRLNAFRIETEVVPTDEEPVETEAPRDTYRRRPPPETRPPKNPPDRWAIPSWFNTYQPDLPDSEFFGYVPWIPEHSDALINLIKPHVELPIAPVRIVANVLADEQRLAAMAYTFHAPEAFRQLVMSRLTPLKGRIRGMIFTFDWHPFMQVISLVCQDLGIERILVPHESVFADRDMYYVHTTSGADRPSADIVLGWGDLQKEIFTERRYPPERIEVMGAPKFDRYRSNPNSQLTRAQYCRIFGLDDRKPIVLFSAQPLDSQYNAQVARSAQQQIITDLISVCKLKDWQLIVRTPPSRAADVVGEQLRKEIDEFRGAAIDQSGFYRVQPFEALFHCDVMVSINSTMLFEAILLNKPAVSAKYLEFTSFWQQTDVIFAHNTSELKSALIRSIEAPAKDTDLSWANKALSNGSFDGNAARRIGAVLNEIGNGKRKLTTFDPMEYFILNKHVSGGNIAIDTLVNLKRHHVYVPAMLNADNVGVPATTEDMFKYDHYCRWGLADTDTKIVADKVAFDFGRTPLYIEDGFIRSPGLGLSGDPGLSIILDDLTPYYDATRLSRMQKILNSYFTLTETEETRANALIAKIRKHRVSKYNHAPIMDIRHLRKQDKAILLVDQRFGDQSILHGRSGPDTFMQMILTAAAEARDTDVFIKVHPDAITGGKESCLVGSGSHFLTRMANVHLLSEDINPYSVLEAVDEVWVGTSGMGFEALIAGKAVRCFGVPFYSGRGLTVDEQETPERVKARSLAEIFHVAYIMLSRYYDPRAGKTCELEDLLDYLIEVSLGVEPYDG